MAEEAQNCEEEIRRQLSEIESGHGDLLGVSRIEMSGDAKAKLHRQILEYAATSDRTRMFEIRAEECRTIADSCSDVEAKSSYESLGRHYDQMATFARR
jgi:hypothetical protein